MKYSLIAGGGGVGDAGKEEALEEGFGKKDQREFWVFGEKRRRSSLENPKSGRMTLFERKLENLNPSLKYKLFFCLDLKSGKHLNPILKIFLHFPLLS